MKKIYFIIMFASIFLFSGCYDAVFQSIRREVELEDALVSGLMNSIVRYTGTGKGLDEGKEYLFLQNGQILYKQISEDGEESKDEKDRALTKNARHGKWDSAPNRPSGLSYDYFAEKYSGYYISKLASDQNYVYALACVPEKDEDQSRNVLYPRELLYYPDENGGWGEIPGVADALKVYIKNLKDTYYLMDASVHLFCTNTPQKAHRKAYLRIGGGSPYNESDVNKEENYGKTDLGNYGIIELAGPNTDVKKPIEKGKNNASYKTLSVVYFNGEYRFLDYVAACTNETKATDATWYCYGKDKAMLIFDDFSKDTGDDETETPVVKSFEASASILSICVTKDYIIVGTDEKGAFHANLGADGKPILNDKGNPEFSTINVDGASAMGKPYIIRALLCTDPTIPELGNEESATDAMGETTTKKVGSAIYSTMQFRSTESSKSAAYKNVGLWAYYSGKGNWNRE